MRPQRSHHELLPATKTGEARTGNDDNTHDVFPRHKTKRRESRTRHLDGGLSTLSKRTPQPQQKSQQQHNTRPTAAQQNHTSRPHLIQTTRPMRLGRPPVSGQMSGQ